jgi:hypothetical protein
MASVCTAASICRPAYRATAEAGKLSGHAYERFPPLRNKRMAVTPQGEAFPHGCVTGRRSHPTFAAYLVASTTRNNGVP